MRNIQIRTSNAASLPRSLPLSRLVLAAFATALLVPTAHAQLVDFPTTVRENASGPFGPSVEGGQFGEHQLVGDFDGDGYDDLAVSRRAGPVGTFNGLVHVLRGGPSGLVYWQTLSQSEADDFGEALATCDLDRDGDDDLIVGAPASQVDGEDQAGLVYVYSGSDLGLFLAQPALDREALGRFISGDVRFGASLTTGDFDGDGECDVAIGAPEDDDTGTRGSTVDAGSVSVVFGLGNGSLNTSGSLHLRESLLPTTQGGVEPAANDRFGFSLATAPPAPGQPGDRLVVGVPDKGGAFLDEGRVWLVAFNGRALLDDGSAFVDFGDDSFLMPNPKGGERFGFSLAVGRVSGSGAWIVAGTPGYSSATLNRIGAAYLLSLDGFTGPSPVIARLDQDLHVFDSTPYGSEEFGFAVLAVDLDRDGWDDLVISAPSDIDESTRGFGPSATGAIHVLFGGQGLSRFTNRFGSQVTSEDDEFGQSIAAGNFGGDGGLSISVGAPRTDLPTRGISPDEWHGAVYVYGSDQLAQSSSLVARTGTAPLGDGSELVEISDAARTHDGLPGYRGLFAPSEGARGGPKPQARVVVGGVEREAASDVPCMEGDSLGVGLALHSTSIFGYRDRVEVGCATQATQVGVVAAGAFVATELNPLPGGAVGFPSRFLSTADGRVYFRGIDVLDTVRILRTAENGQAPVEVALGVGDPAGPDLFVKGIDRFDVSENGTHLIYQGVLGNIADFEAVMLDGAPVLTFGSPIPGTGGAGFRGGDTELYAQNFSLVAVDDAGGYLTAARDQYQQAWLLRGAHDSAPHSALSSSGVFPESDLEPLAVSLTDGVALHLWGTPPVNRGTGEAAPSTKRLLVSCGGDLQVFDEVLRVGQLVDLGDGGAPAEVLDLFEPASSEGLELGSDQRVHLRIEAHRGTDQFQAIVGVDVPCPLFADGFESGSTLAWQ